MELDSVRSLKAEIRERIVRPFVAEAMAAGRIGVMARSLATASRRQPTIALGVAKGRRKGDLRLAIRVQRTALDSVALRKQIEEIGALARGEHDLRVIGRVRKRAAPPWHRAKQRPLLIGASIGHVDITAGTLGAIALHRATGRPVLLSNNHVLANESRARVKDPILQAGHLDGGKAPRDVVGRLLETVELRLDRPNKVDAATARIASGIPFDPVLLTDLGTFKGVDETPLMPGDKVVKLGRTTGLTRGEVIATEVDDLVVGFEIGDLTFNDQVEIDTTGNDPFSAGGDSGSLILGRGLRARALLFAGSEQGGRQGLGVTYANPIKPVLSALGISLDIAALSA